MGDPIDRVYADRVLAAALISDAVDAYDAGRYREALDLYNSALQTAAGDQLRTYNGIYLATWRLGRDSEAQQAFARIVEYGLSNKSMAFKILFKPGSTAFWPDPNISGPYDMWLKTIALQTARKNECLEVRGHTSPTGPEPLNERLSQLRAEYIKQRLTDDQPTLGNRIITVGMGSRETLIGTGKDDVTDALDRRVTFDVVGC